MKNNQIINLFRKIEKSKENVGDKSYYQEKK